jgi:1A family penicillin-binding protein
MVLNLLGTSSVWAEMDIVLVKIFAVALTFSQLATEPEPRTSFDPTADQQHVIDLLRAGCERMKRAFDVEAINIDDLIATAMDDPEAASGGHAAYRGIKIADLHVAYKQFCKNETIVNPVVDIQQVIDFYNRTLADLPDHARLKGGRLPGASEVLDLKGERFGEVHERDQRRVWVSLADIPIHVQQAFVAAEDKRFYEHKGIDERALVRSFIGNLTQAGRPQGGSTITQQVVKNLLVGDELSYERKMREMVLASRLEHTLSKSEILELYLNSIFLGRGASGVEMAARSYFGKSARDLTLSEGALLAGITKGPNYYSPIRNVDRARERFRYALGRMQDDGAITAEQDKQALAAFPDIVPDDQIERPPGSYFADYVARELTATSRLSAFRVGSYRVRSTLQPDLQQATELALQEGLANYEKNAGRVEFQGPELNLSAAMERAAAEPDSSADPDWLRALRSARLPHDIQWKAAVVIEKGGSRRGEAIRVGLSDGRTLPLSGPAAILRSLKLHDVIWVRVTEGKGKAVRAELRVRPVVQGAAVVIENKTGRILAMAGGFSYAGSQLNRVTQSQRQPGSSLKPLTYLAALQKGLQPNTLVRDQDITFPPIQASKRSEDYWSPKNYDGSSSGIITLRSALEKSRNLATVSLLDGGIASNAPSSLDQVCALAVELKIYKECERYYPFVLGAQPVRPIDLAQFYATIANEGMRPTPHAIEAIEQNGNIVYQTSSALEQVNGADRASFFQLKTLLQGVVQRGTAHRIGSLAPYVAGKTGTTDDENDTWFVGFSNDVTVAVWVGYDNADGRRRTLGSGQTGASVALPIFEPIMQGVWAYHAPRALLDPPSPEARRLLVSAGADGGRRGKQTEYLRRDAVDARYALVSRREGGEATASTTRSRRQHSSPAPAQAGVLPERSSWGWDAWGQRQRDMGRWNDWRYRGYDGRERATERNDGPRPSPYERRAPSFFFQPF